MVKARAFPRFEESFVLVHGRKPIDRKIASDIGAQLKMNGHSVLLYAEPSIKKSPHPEAGSFETPKHEVMESVGFRFPGSHVIILSNSHETGQPKAQASPVERHVVYDGMGETLRAGHHYLHFGSPELLPAWYDPIQNAFVPRPLLRHHVTLTANAARLEKPPYRQQLVEKAMGAIRKSLDAQETFEEIHRVGKRIDPLSLQHVALKKGVLDQRPNREFNPDGRLVHSHDTDVEGFRETIRHALRIKKILEKSKKRE
ncbi:hypothetical protein KJ765_04615 [Candidatus Micrarchaeota archaeon]|nr:hypothetical protein [Candidatus Micrarchaeota archaeon]